MPGAPRPSGKSERIAYAILGTPSNMLKRRGKNSKREKILVSQESRFSR